MVDFAQREGKRRDWHTWWCFSQNVKEMEVRQERRIWQRSRTDGDTRRIGGKDVLTPCRLPLPRGSSPVMGPTNTQAGSREGRARPTGFHYCSAGLHDHDSGGDRRQWDSAMAQGR